MEQEKNALAHWLESREKSRDIDPDDDFVTMLAEIFRGQPA